MEVEPIENRQPDAPAKPKEIHQGQTVKITAKHLAGIKGTVFFFDKVTQTYVVRISEHGFEGHLVAFTADELEPVN